MKYPVQEIFVQQREAIDHFFEKMDIGAIEQLLELMEGCEGLLFFSGVGKSGLVAQKVAGTFTSTGTRSLYISPTDALHGDIGLVSKKDLFLIFSKSGQSDELVKLIPAVRHKGATVIVISCETRNRLAEAADHHICLPLKQEICPFDLAPTTSTVIQMMFGDILATALMRAKKFTLDDFATNHPAGRLGKRITLKVSDVMLKGDRVPKCLPEETLVNTLGELSSKQAGCVLVVDPKNTLQGIFTDGDLRRALEKHGPEALQKPMISLMTPSPRFITPNILAWKAMQEMELDRKHLITVLPVLEEGERVVGLVKLHDILQEGM